MSIPIIVMGDSGTGKTYSLRNFEEGELEVVNVTGKPMSFFGSFPDVVDVPALAGEHPLDNGLPAFRADVVKSWLKRHRDHRAVAVDDCGYCITEMYVRLTEGDEKLKDQYEVYKRIASKMWWMFSDVMTDGDRNRIVYFMFHEEADQNGKVDLLTVGKLLNEKIKIRGLVTCTFQSAREGDRYGFHTNNANPAKCPPGLFEDEFIDNDLKMVDARIREAYRMEPLEAVRRHD